MNTALETVKKTAKANAKRMSHKEAEAWLLMKANRKSDKAQMVRDLTGGFWSQSIDHMVCLEVGKAYRKA